MISFSTQSRDHSYQLIVEAIKRGMQHCHAHNTLTLQTKHSAKGPLKNVHETDCKDSGAGDARSDISGDCTDLAALFRQRVLDQYQTAAKAFGRFEVIEHYVQDYPYLFEDQASGSLLQVNCMVDVYLYEN